MFRWRQGIKLSYNRQGYVYFVSRNYALLSERQRAKIRGLCSECGGPNGDALLEFVTSDATVTAITMKYYTSRATLYRAARRYYEHFPDHL